MSAWWWIAIGSSAAVVAGLGVAIWLWRRSHGHDVFEQARKKFTLRREWLEAEFLTLAAASGKPRGLRWTDCDFEDPVAFARDRRTGHYRALVGVTIRFEAVEGGGMEDVEAVGNLKAATVVFRLDGPDWEADGRAYFNLTPKQTIEHYQHELDTVD